MMIYLGAWNTLIIETTIHQLDCDVRANSVGPKSAKKRLVQIRYNSCGLF